MDGNLITVIVPIYNVSKYINRCIESILAQKYINIEIILIDDGSTDDSGKICDEYAKKDLRIKVIHKENEGVSKTRNYGIDISNGDYITFIDADDYIDENMYFDMMNIQHLNAIPDIITSGYYYETEAGKIFDSSNVCDKKYDVLNSESAFNEIFTGRFGAYIWNKLFKKELLDKFKIRFEQKIHSGEDLLFVCECIAEAKNIVHCNKNYYHYVKRKDSVTNSKFNDKLLSSRFAYEKIVKIADSKFSKSLVDVKVCESFEICNLIYKLHISKRDKAIENEYRHLLRKNKKEIFSKNNVSKKINLINKIMYINCDVGILVWKLYKKYRSIKNKY